MMRGNRALGSCLSLGLFLALGATAGCSSPTRPAHVPEDHTVEHGGAFHAPGLKDPTSQCTTCHGPNLAGGTDGEPSCFSCHGQKWD